MKLDACWMKVNKWTALLVRVGLIAGLRQSGRRSNRSYATSVTPTAIDTTVITVVMTTGVEMIETIATTIETMIGGDEFHSLGTNPRA